MKKIIRSLVRDIYYKYYAQNLLYELQIRARNESVDYIQENMKDAVIFDNQKGRLLTFKENTEINFSIHSEDDPYFKNNLSVINNSPQEILDAAIEMEERLKGNNSDNETVKLNDQFWKSIINNNEEKINFLKNELKLSVSYKFLKDNQNLL